MNQPTVLSTAERERHKYMMSHPGDWPIWPKLPLKRSGYEVNAGFVVPSTEHPFRVMFTNIYLIPKDVKTFGDLYDKVPYKDYTDYDAILDDGWRVD